MSDEILTLEIPYGSNGLLKGEVLAKQVLAHYQPQANVTDIASALRNSFNEPLEFPRLSQACVAGDKIVLALDDQTPRADAVIALLWKELSSAGVLPEDVLILQPGTWQSSTALNPRSLLPKEIQEKIQLQRHDPTDEENYGYLASTAAGERIYFANTIIEADMVIPIGPAAFDPILGYRGEASFLYPAYSDTAAIVKQIGHGHDELTSSDSRPLRQQAEEIGWLLGIQFVISIIPGRGKGIQTILAGLADAVAREVRQELESTCKLKVSERAELVVVAVEEGETDQTWDQVATAIDTARRIVERDGRIVVLSQLKEKRGPGLDILSQVRNPSDALKPIQKENPHDFRAATNIAKAADWANVYLLSEVPSDQIEELFLIPVANEKEVQKLLTGDETKIIVECAQKVNAFCQ
ncbi:lactate racemase domain-containing protein [bacterium]|nr:lactate racemase domain-containing protein [bacterium]MDB4802812.1 lactate racemase domain-containing protein [bacterium]